MPVVGAEHPPLLLCPGDLWYDVEALGFSPTIRQALEGESNLMSTAQIHIVTNTIVQTCQKKQEGSLSHIRVFDNPEAVPNMVCVTGSICRAVFLKQWYWEREQQAAPHLFLVGPYHSPTFLFC